jgi:signal recognition particle subunit SRP68
MADVTMTDATKGEAIEAPKFDLEILATALSARGTNGVKHLDYRRYRQYCARRLRRMRTNPNVSFTHGKSRSYVNRRVTAEDVTDVRMLMIPLFMAERCWSTAQELHSDWANAEQNVNAKDDDTDIGGGAHLRWRLHAMRRMAKAAYWSRQLKELCSQVADDRTVLEAEAYAATMSGWTHYIRDDHQEALTNLRRAETVYTQLHSLGTTSQQAVYAQQLDTIQPLIKWCQAQQGVVDGGADAATTPGDLNILADEGMRHKFCFAV